jgi:iduronate 2-sulfatase
MLLKSIKALIVFLILSGLMSCDQSAEERMNVVFIICDDLNDAIEGMEGHPQSLTPNINKLMKEGVMFSNAQTNAPICGPSRASLWSGLYPHTTGYYGYQQQKNHWRNNPLLSNTVTVFEHLSKNGYTVYASGKIHHNGHEDWSIFENPEGESGFKVYPSFGPYPWDGRPETNNVRDRGVIHPDMPSNYGSKSCWDSFGPIYNISDKLNGKGTWLYNHDGEEYVYIDSNNRDLMPDERCALYAGEILEQQHDKPFFMAVGFNRPHSPCYVPEKYFNKFSPDSLELAPYLRKDLEDCSPIFYEDQDIGSGGTGFYKYKLLKKAGGDSAILAWTRAYLASVNFVDEQIGKVVNAVKSSAYADNTLIILSSDHGYHMGEKEYIFKNTLWEESSRIPLIIAAPGAERNKICAVPVSLIDIYPTIVDYCNLPQEPNIDGNQMTLDGFSLRPLITDPEVGNWEGKDFAITSVASSQALEVDEPGEPGDQHFSLRTETYRYIYYRDGSEELYDHTIDPYEWNNLAKETEYSGISDSLQNLLISNVFKN